MMEEFSDVSAIASGGGPHNDVLVGYGSATQEKKITILATRTRLTGWSPARVTTPLTTFLIQIKRIEVV